MGREQPVPLETSASHQATQTALQPRPAEPTDSSLAQSPQQPGPDVGSAVQTAHPQIGQTPAPGATSAPLAKPDSAAEPGGLVPPVVEPAQVDRAPEATAETPTPGVSQERVRVTAATNIHTGPSNSSVIIGAAHPGAEAVVASRESDWVQIVDPVAGKTGWIRSASLAPSTEDAASTEVPDEAARSATVVPKPRAKAKKYRTRRHYGRRGSDSGSRLGGNFGVGWNLVCSFQPKEMAYVSIGNNRDGQAADPTKEEAPPRTAGLVFLGNS